jgi:hypothetical protein
VCTKVQTGSCTWDGGEVKVMTVIWAWLRSATSVSVICTWTLRGVNRQETRYSTVLT